MRETPHTPKYINPFTDFGFKKIFGEEANEDLLIDFLNELLAPQNQHIKDLTYNKSEEELETNFDKWLYVIKNLHRLENIPERLKTKIFEKLFKTAAYSALNKEERSKYEESLKYYNDLKNSLDTAFDEGNEEARVELLPIIEKERKQKEEALDTIRKMIKNLHVKGLSVSEIATITGKPEGEIKKMLK